MLPQLSIIIPTHRREALLKLTLDSLLEQTTPFSKFEVIVVDNDDQPHPPTQSLCASPAYHALTLKVVHHPVLGVSEARNCGIRYTSAPLVGFMDDDEKLAPYWVERALEISNSVDPDIFGGPYHPYYTASKPAWFNDRYLLMSHGTIKAWLNEGQYLFGGNLFIKRAWLDRLGGFSPELGRKGSDSMSGEAEELQLRAYRMGARILYDPDLYILHYAPSEHLTPGWYIRSAWFDGQSHAKIETLNPTPGPRPSLTGLFVNILRNGLRVTGRYLGLLFRSRKVYPFLPSYLIERVSPAVMDFAASWFAFGYRLRSKR